VTRSATVDTVIRYLGRLSMIALAGSLYLTWVVIQQAAKAGSVDAVAVGLVGSSWTLTGALIAGLTAMLVSTRSEDDTQNVNVVNPPTDPVPVEPGDPAEVPGG
jgi:hypothetical protein